MSTSFYESIGIARKTAVVVLFAFIVISMGRQIVLRNLEWTDEQKECLFDKLIKGGNNPSLLLKSATDSADKCPQSRDYQLARSL